MTRTLMTGLMALIVWMGLLIGLTACGGGSGSGSGPVVVADGGDDGEITEDGGEEDGGEEDGGEDAEPDATGYTAIEVTDGGSITGKLVFKGDAGADATYEYQASEADAKVCAGGGMAKGNVRKNPRLAVDGGALADVVVYLEISKGAAAEPTSGATIDNLHCEFNPLVQVVTNKTKTVLVKNSDASTHNSKGAFTPLKGGDSEQMFNPNLGAGKTWTYEDGFEQPGVIRLTCDQHYWMEGFVVVMNHPYFAVTGKDGKFEIKNIPAGSYTVHFWHAGYKLQKKDGKMAGYEKPKSWSVKVEVKAGGATDMGEIEYK